MPLKILQFVPEALPTFRADVATLFGKYLPRHGVQCDVVGMASSTPPSEQGFASVRSPAYHSSRLRRELSYAMLVLRTLLRAQRAEYAAIQVRDMVSIGLLALLVARCKGIPFYYWVSYLMSEGRIEQARSKVARGAGLRSRMVMLKGQLEQTLLYRVVLPSAQHVFVQSDAMLEFMHAKGVARARMTAVPMGVDMELFGTRPVEPQRPDGWHHVPLIAYLGTLDKARQLERVLDALLLLRQSHPQAALLLIGSSPTSSDEADLLAYAGAIGLGADALRVTGWLPVAKAWNLLAGADAAISYIPRGMLYDVSSPTKLLEYLALGMPAVGNDTPDQARVLAESRAGWVTGSAPAAMARALADILNAPAEARSRASAGVGYIDQQRSYRILAERVARRYHDLV